MVSYNMRAAKEVVGSDRQHFWRAAYAMDVGMRGSGDLDREIRPERLRFDLYEMDRRKDDR